MAIPTFQELKHLPTQIGVTPNDHICLSERLLADTLRRNGDHLHASRPRCSHSRAGVLKYQATRWTYAQVCGRCQKDVRRRLATLDPPIVTANDRADLAQPGMPSRLQLEALAATTRSDGDRYPLSSQLRQPLLRSRHSLSVEQQPAQLYIYLLEINKRFESDVERGKDQFCSEKRLPAHDLTL